MNVATSAVLVGIRDLKNGLSSYLDRVRAGEEIVVTDRGRPVARLTPMIDPPNRLAALVASGLVRPPLGTNRARPARRVDAAGPVSDLVADERR